MFAYARVDNAANKEYLVIFNPSEQVQTIEMNEITLIRSIINEGKIVQDNNKTRITLPRLSYAVYEVQQ